MTGRFVFSFIIVLITSVIYQGSGNPIAFYISLLLILLFFLCFTLSLFGLWTIRRKSGNWQIIAPHGIIMEGTTASGSLDGRENGFLYACLPSFKGNLSSFSCVRNMVEYHDLDAKKNIVTFLGNLPPGAYSFITATIYAVDFMGLFKFGRKINLAGLGERDFHLTVLPRILPFDISIDMPLSPLSRIAAHDEPYQREESYFDFKLYEPWDDARRIVWQRYARSNLLTVRIPEERMSQDKILFMGIDPELDLHKIYYRLPLVGNFFIRWHWQRLKDRAIYRLALFWYEGITVRWQLLLDSTGENFSSANILESGNIYFLVKNIQSIQNLFLPALIRNAKQKAKEKTNGRQNRMAKGIWYISGRELFKATDYVPLWQRSFYPVREKGLKEIFRLSLKEIFFEKNVSYKNGPRFLVLRLMLIFMEYRNMLKGKFYVTNKKY